LNSMTENL